MPRKYATNAERQAAYRARKKSKALDPRPRDEKGRILPVPEEHIERMLATIAQGYSVRRAAKETGHDHRALDYWRKKSPENEARYQEAYEAGTEMMEDEAIRRGAFGYEEITRNGKGEIIRQTTRYDSKLLQITLGARKPEKYRDHFPPGGAQPTVIVIRSAFSDVRPNADIELEAVEAPPALPEGTE